MDRAMNYPVLKNGPVSSREWFGISRDFDRSSVMNLECRSCHLSNITVAKRLSDGVEYFITGMQTEFGLICHSCLKKKQPETPVISDLVPTPVAVEQESPLFCDACGHKGHCKPRNFLYHPIMTHVMVVTEKVVICESCETLAPRALATKLAERLRAVEDLELRSFLENELERVSRRLAKLHRSKTASPEVIELLEDKERFLSGRLPKADTPQRLF